MLRFNKPKDLGVTYTQKDLENMDKQLGLTVEKIKGTDSNKIEETLTFEGSKIIVGTFSNAEVTAQINRASEYWKYTPLRQMQVKSNPDGTAEASGILDIKKLKGFIAYFGYSSADLDKGLEYINATNLTHFPIYFKGKGSITNNQVTLELQLVEVYGFALPSDVTKQAEVGLVAITESVISKVGSSKTQIEKLELKDEKAYLKVEIPERIKAVAE